MMSSEMKPCTVGRNVKFMPETQTPEPFVAPRAGIDPEFIGPLRQSFWTHIQPIASDFAAINALNAPIEVDDDPMQALVIRDGNVHPSQRNAAKFIRAKEKAGQWLALNLSARGISTGSYQALEDLGEAIRIARQIAEGESFGMKLPPTIEDRVKAVQAIAVGVKSYAEMSETLIKQLAPVAPKDDGKPKAPRGPSRDQPVTAIQAENVYINGNQQTAPASNGTPSPASVSETAAD